jgi:hypothetical protein
VTWLAGAARSNRKKQSGAMNRQHGPVATTWSSVVSAKNPSPVVSNSGTP